MLSCSGWKESNFSALVPVLPKWLLAPCVVSYKYLPINDSLTWRYLYIFLCFQGIWDILGRVEITWYSPGGKLELNLAFRCLKKALLIRWPTVIFEWRKERSAIISLSFQLSLCLRFLKHTSLHCVPTVISVTRTHTVSVGVTVEQKSQKRRCRRILCMQVTICKREKYVCLNYLQLKFAWEFQGAVLSDRAG